MKPPQAFGVAVRVVGLLGWLVAFFYLVSTLVVIVAPDYRAGVRPWWQYALAALIFFLLGWFLLRRADRVVAFAYRISNSDASDA
jgi:hypothetical protein